MKNEFEIHIIRKCGIVDTDAIILEKYNLPQADRERNKIELLAPGTILISLVLCKVVISSTVTKGTTEDN